jgi:hypothetical protein
MRLGGHAGSIGIQAGKLRHIAEKGKGPINFVLVGALFWFGSDLSSAGVFDEEPMKLQLIMLMGALSVAGCATITRGTNDVLVVNSTPGGAEVKLSNGESCTGTPCTFKLPRKSELNVLIQKPGCKPQQVRVTNRVAGSGGAAMAGNIVFGGIIGAGVDAGTGATQELVPNPVSVTLECKGR